MRIRKHDGPTRFFVQSEPGKDEYLVELETHGLTGECTCPHFQKRLLGEVQKGFRGKDCRCKHIKAARDSMAISLNLTTDEQLDTVLRQYAKTQNPSPSQGPWPPPEPVD